ncbi:MAG: NADP-dependent isocitrate dehydrogenase [Planctomycetota bacterium]|jgi:isocitrate dehydrogenase
MSETPTGSTPVTLIAGDGIGPEVVDASVRVVEGAGVQLHWERCVAGAEVFRGGNETGVPDETIQSIHRTGIVLKGPLETPVGYGEKSANVTLRKMFELYANVRPARELPGVPTPFGGHHVDLVVVRENVEDLYAGIEHMQTPGVAQTLKLMSRKGCEKICRLAFELARSEGREHVHCATKANIMKLTEGLLKRTFEDVAKEYPDIRSEHIIIDNCAHQLVRFPEQFEVIVTSNMNGDILSDLTSGLAGGLGFAPSANMGHEVVMFEAVHGSAPTIAGKNVANPTAMILSACMMLQHLGYRAQATMIHHALLVTLEEGKVVTVDVRPDVAAGTREFADEVIANLGRHSPRWYVRDHKPMVLPDRSPVPDQVKAAQRTVGMDVFVESGRGAAELGPSLERAVEPTAMRLKMISNRGIKVYPETAGMVDCVDHWRCRFIARQDDQTLADSDFLDVLRRVGDEHRWMHVEKLVELDGEPGYSKAAGED